MKTTKLTKSKLKKFRARQRSLRKQIDKWHSGKLSLTGLELEQIRSEIRTIDQTIQETCTHAHAVIHKGSWTDSGYGCDQHWDAYNIYCTDCEQTILSGGAESDTVRAITDPQHVDNLIAEYVFRFERQTPSDKLEKLGYTRVDFRTETIQKYET